MSDELYTVDLEFTGTAPLLCHNPTYLADPRNEQTRQLSALTSRGNKRSDTEYEECEALEFALGLYHDDDIGPFMPMRNVVTMLATTGSRYKLKAAILRAHFYEGDGRIPIQYDGPRDVTGMLEAGFAFTRPIVLNRQGSKSTVLRTHPRFWPWSLACSVGFDGEEVEIGKLGLTLDRANRMSALGDLRPNYGRFDLRWRIDHNEWQPN